MNLQPDLNNKNKIIFIFKLFIILARIIKLIRIMNKYIKVIVVKNDRT